MKKLLLPRRSLILGGAAAICAPAIVRAGFMQGKIGSDDGFSSSPVSTGATSVAFDAVGTDLLSGASVITASYTGMTVGAGLTHSALIVSLVFDSQAITGVSAVWDSGGSNQSMTLISSANSGGAVGNMQLWGLVNPAAGNKTLAVNWTGATQVTVCAASFQHVNQTGGATSFPAATPATGSGTAASIAVTSSATGMVMGVSTAGNHVATITAVGNTTVYSENSGQSASCANRDAGAASVTLTATYSIISSWGYVATGIVAG